MARKQWIKLPVNFFSDRRIIYLRSQRNGSAYVWAWIKLLLLAGQIQQDGFLCEEAGKALTMKELGQNIGEKPAFMERALAYFEDLDMIGRDEEGRLYIRDWDEFQGAR